MDYRKLAEEEICIINFSHSKDFFSAVEPINKGEDGVLLWMHYNKKNNVFAGELAENLGLSSGRIANILKNLEKKKYIVRGSDAKDMRKVSVILTDNGRVHITGVYQKAIDQHEKIFRALGERDSLEFIRILKRGHELILEGKI
ncbi:DNA-binding transcriptional regulator, MarR family [Anaerocolumna jejuensis DSM 15929]|jgi:DNA-binding MarR family transcriptional regulator|uniref:DNA-binding transcriptional regulator, MarR family n=1 Tax=Anaerocolumna jejuensis DSM 15929 TaxID=1121322 RepID=A0A1M6L3C8_9FIRM|nr:MarR family transcriptional regulator [Anaerocolumna jejuensis]SHJ65644.1 DNA-binding transcriptional regulator, MarR family [Anaerocolumna jejuensis DSM 15929]